MQSSMQAAQTATPFPEFLFSPPVGGKDKDHIKPENEVQETVLYVLSRQIYRVL